jgi:tRNA pseudouridine32 synthase/23S rRNA pseudouridine746 synthase
VPNQLVPVFGEEVHQLAKFACEKLQKDITERAKIDVNFRLNHGNDTKKIGKMFGVLVVKNKFGELGYLQAFSGKLGDSNHHDNFVPPIFDLLDENNYFNQGMSEITILTQEINVFKNSYEFKESQSNFKEEAEFVASNIKKLNSQKSKFKQERKLKRSEAKIVLSAEEYAGVEKEMAKESVKTKVEYKAKELELKTRLAIIFEKNKLHSDRLNKMIENRKVKSSKLQQQLFDEYKFVNKFKEVSLLRTIFNDPNGKKMPAGAGECSAPKLFQYAFLNDYEPLALAEFWWGKSPKSESKVHKQYYPPCTDKCIPILGYMLS